MHLNLKLSFQVDNQLQDKVITHFGQQVHDDTVLVPSHCAAQWPGHLVPWHLEIVDMKFQDSYSCMSSRLPKLCLDVYITYDAVVSRSHFWHPNHCFWVFGEGLSTFQQLSIKSMCTGKLVLCGCSRHFIQKNNNNYIVHHQHPNRYLKAVSLCALE